MIRIIVAHPGQQHSFRTATALKRTGMLYKYMTTVYDRKGSMTSWILPFLSSKDLTKAKRRRCEALADTDVIQYLELPALLTIFFSHFPKLHKLKDWWNLQVARRFNKKVIRYAIDNNVDGIIVYDGTAKRYLDTLASNTITVMDVSIAVRPWIRHVYEQDMERFGHKDFYEEDPTLWNDYIIGDIRSDLSHCKYFLAASSVVKESLIYCGIKPSQIKILPYGVDIEQFSPIEHIGNTEGLNMIFVGQINRRKGLHHLLKCVRELNGKVNLFLVGGINPASDLYKEYRNDNNITFTGFIDKTKLKEYYAMADVFVLPSLAEGMSLAGLEAMAFGMPILCSDHSGINDLVENGVNGYVFKTGDIDEMKNRICWFVDNKDKCCLMGKRSREIAIEHTWERYNTDFEKIIKEIINQ